MSKPSTLRKKLPWFPTIDYDACIADLDCVNFCPHQVYEWDAETGKPVVARPYNCVPGCDSCAQMCKTQAISFPTKEKLQAALRQVRAEAQPSKELTPDPEF